MQSVALPLEPLEANAAGAIRQRSSEKPCHPKPLAFRPSLKPPQWAQAIHICRKVSWYVTLEIAKVTRPRSGRRRLQIRPLSCFFRFDVPAMLALKRMQFRHRAQARKRADEAHRLIMTAKSASLSGIGLARRFVKHRERWQVAAELQLRETPEVRLKEASAGAKSMPDAGFGPYQSTRLNRYDAVSQA
jgi:hypothetical protein